MRPRPQPRSPLPRLLLLGVAPALGLRTPPTLAPAVAWPREEYEHRRLDEELASGCNAGTGQSIYDLTPITCTEGPVWIIAEFKDREVPPWVRGAVPICLQKLAPCRGRNFWEGRMRAVHSYLAEAPRVTFVVQSDDDVILNPLGWPEVMRRFELATTPKARVVLSTEQTCWVGDFCDLAWAQNWLEKVRSGKRDPGITSFLNSQYMGERDAVMAMLEKMLALDISDDQAALHAIVAEDPEAYAIDIYESLFLSLARGFVPLLSGMMTCNFGGRKTLKCGADPDMASWGSCRMEGSRLAVSGTGPHVKSAEEAQPLIVHLNSHAREQVKTGMGCDDAVDRMRGGQ